MDIIVGNKSNEGQDASLWFEMGNPDSNALLRISGASLYYTDEYIRDPEIAKIAAKVRIVLVPGKDE